MSNILIILKHNLKRSLKGWFWVVLVFPIIVNIIGSTMIDTVENELDNSDSYLKLVIYSDDKSEIVDNLINKKKFKKVDIAKTKEEVYKFVQDSESSVGVIFNSKNIFEDIKSNKSNTIEIISKYEDGRKEYVESMLNNGILQIKSYGDTEDEYLKIYKQYENDKYNVINESSNLFEVMMYIIMFGLFGLIFLFIASRCLMPMIKERELKIESRILVSKISKTEYYLGHILGCYILLLLQSIILLAGFYLLNPSFDFSIGWMIVLSFALSFVGISIALIILGICNSSTMYNTLLPILITPMCLLSGGFLPTEFMPQSVQNLSLIFPLTWINSAFKKILMDGNYMSIGLDILVAICISIVLVILYLVLENRKTNRA